MMNNRANEILNNWTPEVASLIATLKRHGFKVLHGNNGEESFKFDGDMKTFIANLIACDEAHLFVRRPGSAKTRWLFLVLGNSPGEIVSDFSIPSNVNANDDALDNATSEHYTRWENRKQPTWTAAQAYPETYGPAAVAEREAAYAPKVFPCPKCGAELPAIKGYERATFRHCVCGNTAIRK